MSWLKDWKATVGIGFAEYLVHDQSCIAHAEGCCNMCKQNLVRSSSYSCFVSTPIKVMIIEFN